MDGLLCSEFRLLGKIAWNLLLCVFAVEVVCCICVTHYAHIKMDLYCSVRRGDSELGQEEKWNSFVSSRCREKRGSTLEEVAASLLGSRRERTKREAFIFYYKSEMPKNHFGFHGGNLYTAVITVTRTFPPKHARKHSSTLKVTFHFR